MDHHGFMVGMLIGGALVAAVPTLIVVMVGIHVLRHYRAQRRSSAGETGEEGSL